MNPIQNAKKCILDHYSALDKVDEHSILKALSFNTHTDWKCYAVHPFNETVGHEAIAEKFWIPYLKSMHAVQRRQDIFFAGLNEIDHQESVWVVSMGHFLGLFDQPFLGIAPTGKIAFLRYCEFHKVEEGKITQTAFFCDLPHLMYQANAYPFPPQTAAQLIQPGPQTHDGLLYQEGDLNQGEKTLALINKMIRDIGTWKTKMPLEDELKRTWHDDMIWWGPTGIGATFTIPRYAQQHAAIFRTCFSQRSEVKHLSRLAEGHYGGFFGWPNFTAIHEGGFMGMPANPKPCGFRVIDIYRRQNDKLAENWIFIDLLHWLYQQGLDVLKRNHLENPPYKTN